MPIRAEAIGRRLRQWAQDWRWWPVIVWYVALALCTLYVLSVIFLIRPSTSLAVDAQTEYMSFIATDPRELSWNVGGFDLEGCLHSNTTPERLHLEDNVSLKLGVGVTVNVTKADGSPQADIEFISAPSATTSPIGRACSERSGIWLVQADSTEQPLYGSRVRLTRRDPDAPAGVFPLRGMVTLGQDPAAGPQEILFSGQVSLHASNLTPKSSSVRTWLQGNLSYVPQTLLLQRGDVVLPPSKEKDLSQARGFLRVPAKDVLQVGYFVEAGQVIVQRPGNATLQLTLTPWDRLKNEPDLTAAVAILVTLLGAGKLAEDLGKGWRFASKSRP